MRRFLGSVAGLTAVLLIAAVVDGELGGWALSLHLVPTSGTVVNAASGLAVPNAAVLPVRKLRIPSEDEIAAALFAAEFGEPYGAFTDATGEFELTLRAQDCRFIGPISSFLFGPPKPQPFLSERGYVIVSDGFEPTVIELPRSAHDGSAGEPTVDLGIVRLRPAAQQGILRRPRPERAEWRLPPGESDVVAQPRQAHDRAAHRRDRAGDVEPFKESKEAMALEVQMEGWLYRSLKLF